MRIDANTRLSVGELGGQLKQSASVSAALHVIAHGDTTEHGDLAMKIDANDADSRIAVPQKKRVVIRPMLVGMLGVVS